MHVIIEGPDGVGKTTLANYIRDEYDIELIHNDASAENTLAYYQSLCDGDKVIDRANLSELVYSIVYGRETRMTMDDQLEFFNDYLGIYIICYASDYNDLKNRFDARGDTVEVSENLRKINDIYTILAKLLPEAFTNVYALDISKYRDKEAMIQYFEDVRSF